MREGKVIDHLFLEKNGKLEEITLRFPKRGDAERMMKFYNRTLKESRFLTGLPVTKKEEEKWLSKYLKNMRKKNNIYIFALHGDAIIGWVRMDRGENDSGKHIGFYGVVVLKKYWNLGLGAKMTELLFDIAKKQMKIEIVRLHVVGQNTRAFKMYRKFGFKRVGVIPRGIKKKSGYMTDTFMYKVL